MKYDIRRESGKYNSYKCIGHILQSGALTTKIFDLEQSVELFRFKEDVWVYVVFPPNNTIITK